ncbi:MAG: hypothetical protein ACK5LO_17250 [Leucobacter sp.]
MAARTKLEPGQHSIERAQVRRMTRPSGTKYKRLTWSVRLHGSAKPVRKHTEGPIADTDAAIRRKATAEAEQMLRAGAAKVEWKQGDSFARFAEAVVRPGIEQDKSIGDGSRTAYLAALGYLLGECEGHEHERSLSGLTLLEAGKLKAMRLCLEEVSRLHGHETARRAKTLLTGHAIPALIEEDCLTHSPLAGVKLDLKSMAKPKAEGARKGGIALTLEQYNAVYDYLVALDPADGAVAPTRGRWKLGHIIAKRRNAIEVTLLQMGTALRLSEARQVWAGLIEETAEGGVRIAVDGKIAKGGRPRTAHVMDPRIAERVKGRLGSARSPEQLYIGAPADPAKAWTLRAANKELELLYLEMHRELDIEAFAAERSHVWRATMRTMFDGVLTEAKLSAQLGHTEKVGRESYLDAALDGQDIARAQLVLAS